MVCPSVCLCLSPATLVYPDIVLIFLSKLAQGLIATWWQRSNDLFQVGHPEISGGKGEIAGTRHRTVSFLSSEINGVTNEHEVKKTQV